MISATKKNADTRRSRYITSNLVFDGKCNRDDRESCEDVGFSLEDIFVIFKLVTNVRNDLIIYLRYF